MLDATKSEEHRRLLEIELDAVGIRLNKSKPDVVFKKRTTGGVSAVPTVGFSTLSCLKYNRIDYLQYDRQANEN